MEWVLYFALGWWAVVAVLMLTAIAHASTQKPQTRSIPKNQDAQHLQMQMKKF